MFLAYIVIGLLSASLFGHASRGTDPIARLEALAANLTLARASILLGFLTGFIALTLAVATYALTHAVDPHLALLALTCRVIEGALAAVSTVASLTLVGLAAGATSIPVDARTAVATLLLQGDGWFTVSATAFAVGSTLFCYLLLRGRIIPVSLARLGVGASLLLVVLLPVRVLTPLPTWLGMGMWLPMLLFEVPCGIWLLTKGAQEPPARRAAVS
jgi:uncharacterized protein DUF4386